MRIHGGYQIQESMEVRAYATAYLDVLGVGDRLLALERKVLATEDDSSARQAAVEVVRAVSALRSAFVGFMEAANAQREVLGTARQSDPLRDYVDGIKKDHSVLQFFSDGAAVSTRWGGPEWASHCVGLFRLVDAACVCWLTCLAQGFAIRGAIEIGYGIEVFPSEIVGSALAAAHALEEEVSNVPRIILGPKLADALCQLRTLEGEGNDARVARAFSAKVYSMLRTGHDGYLELSPLCPNILERLDRHKGTSLLGAVVHHVKLMTQCGAPVGDDVRRKYEWVASYLSDHVAEHWNGPE